MDNHANCNHCESEKLSGFDPLTLLIMALVFSGFKPSEPGNKTDISVENVYISESHFPSK